MACGRREPPRLVNLPSFGLVASLLNTLPKWPPHVTAFYLRLHNPVAKPSFCFAAAAIARISSTNKAILPPTSIHDSYRATAAGRQDYQVWLTTPLFLKTRQVLVRQPFLTKPLSKVDLLVAPILIFHRFHDELIHGSHHGQARTIK